jgi:hypothetical protein
MGQGTNSIATSTDGMNWVGLGTSVFDIAGTGIDWNGSNWIAVGSGSVNTVAISSDVMANSWTGLGNNAGSTILCVKWMLGAWFIGGSFGIKSSSDNGTTWQLITSQSNCNSISWNGREAIAAGTGSSYIISSADGTTWNAVSVSGVTSGNSVEWNGREWVIATSGSNSVINTVVDSSLNVNTFGNSYSNILTTGYCVGANSGVGVKVFNSRFYLNAGEKLVVYGPSYYDSALIQDTSITMNMNLPV